MTNIVLDTNIIVSAALSPAGYPAQIAALISNTKKVQVFYSIAIFNEYKKVLAYERLNIAPKVQTTMFATLEEFGILIEPPISTISMPDESDRTFYDTAKASGSILITGNLKHYPAEAFIMLPANFLQTMNMAE